MIIKIQAFQVADSFNIKKIRSEFKAEVNSGNNSELFYFFEDKNRYLYIFDYGVVVFGNYDEIAQSELLRFIQPYADGWLNRDLNEEYTIILDEKSKMTVKNNEVIIQNVTPSVVKIVMLNVGQSVALEYYEQSTEEILNSTKQYTLKLEESGKLDVSKKNLLKFIGRVLNVKNNIVDNLYILDDPNLVWDNPELDLLNRNLKVNFDTFARFKDLDYRLQIVENNLKVFTDILNHRESSLLEWVIIALIAIEILNAFFFRH
jgi:required for meiotic nuclear division protein 1